MYLIDTNVISEIRKQSRSNEGVKRFFKVASLQNNKLFLSVITIGELRRGIEMIRYRGDLEQADSLEKWLHIVVQSYAANILDFTVTEAQVWGKLRAPHHQNAIDKQIAATALTYDLVLVTRNIKDFADTGVQLINPWES